MRLLEAQEKLNVLQKREVRYDNYKPQPAQQKAPEPQYQAPAVQPRKPDQARYGVGKAGTIGLRKTLR